VTVSLFAKLRKSLGGSMSREVQLPGWHLVVPRDGGGAERCLASLERRLRRLDRPDALALLDHPVGGETLRELSADPSRMELMLRIVGRFEENCGEPGLLAFGQPLMLDPAPDDYQRGDPELSDRWIMLLDWNYPRGCMGPVPLISSVCVYSHAHRGLLAAVDRDNPDNPGQIAWSFNPADADKSTDAARVVDGTVKIQLYAHNSAALVLDDNGQFKAGDAPLAAGSIWPAVAKRAKKAEGSLARTGRTDFTPTVDLTPPR